MQAQNKILLIGFCQLVSMSFSCVKTTSSQTNMIPGQPPKIPHYLQCDGVQGSPQQGATRVRTVVHQLARGQGVLQYKATRSDENPKIPMWTAVRAPLSGPNPALTVPYQLEKLDFKPLTCQNIMEMTPSRKISEETTLLIPKDITTKVAGKGFSPNTSQYLRFHIKKVSEAKGKLAIDGYFEKSKITLGGQEHVLQDSIKKGHLMLAKQLVEEMPLYGEKSPVDAISNEQASNLDLYGYHPKRFYGWVKALDLPCSEKDKYYMFDNDLQPMLRLHIEI